MTRSRTAAESVKGVESTVNVDLSAGRTWNKNKAEASRAIGKNNVIAGGSFRGKKSKKMTDSEKKDNKVEASSGRRTRSKNTTAESACTKRNNDGIKKELPEKRTEDSSQTDQSRDTVTPSRPRANVNSQVRSFH